MTALAACASFGLSLLVASCGSTGAATSASTGGGGAPQDGGGGGAGGTALLTDGGPGCTPRTCAELGVSCGPAGDGCGHIVECGTCKAPETCGGGQKASVCGGDNACKPRTCAAASASCGPAGDGCGGLLQCGTCKAPETCGGGGTPSACGGQGGCVPTTCAAQGATCGPVGDGCGGLLQCGSCAGNATCGGGGTPSVCGTPPAPDGGGCVPTTCAAQGASCGPAGDGCGGQLDCGACVAPQTCGGGGTPSVCGGNAACVPTTCAAQGATCGPLGDGCGGLLQCGGCAAPQTCGGGGVPSVCGGNNNCVPSTCAALGAGCGPLGDGCGGLLQCGGCAAPEICGGGGVPSVCGPANGGGGPCINLCKQQVKCPGNGTTTVSGTVYAPNGLDPIYDALVYVPNAPVAPFTPGVACEQCGEAASGSPLVTATSAPDGTFQLQNVPVGTNIPLVIQLGRWRIQLVIPKVLPCQDNPLAAKLTHLPKNKAQGDIPLMALVTGSADPLECVLRKIGLDDAEFTVPAANGGKGRVQLYLGNGATLAGAPPESTLETSAATLDAYDMVILSCEGSDIEQLSATQQKLVAYSNAGGRVFATHYSYVWLYDDSPFSTTATWKPDVTLADPPPSPVTGIVDQTFPKGKAFAQWLQIVGASPAFGLVSLASTRKDFTAVTAGLGQPWIYWNDAAENLPDAPLHYTFNTPVGAAPANQCGRVLYSDFHVSGLTGAGTFPAECDSTPMTAQEHILEFMLFDLASCIIPDVPPPPTCTPLTCAGQGFDCGPEGDGCGNVLQCGTCPAGQTCGGGGQPGVCGGMPCAPETCATLGFDCGPAGDGCGNQLDCGSCPLGQTCGGGGMPGVCGMPSCAPTTCAKLGLDCGPAGDGCGGLLQCGTCPPGQTCGANGMPGVCGTVDAGGCVPQTCVEQGVQCGPAGDGCGGLLQCGGCPPGETCGGGGKPGLCGKPTCTPETCASQGLECGPAGDGCGGLLQCGNCPPGETCGGGGTPGVCGKPSCTPRTCVALHLSCGPAGDGCGGLLQCGTCAPPATCGGGGTPGVCGGGGLR